jgi:hypothetical protein
MGRALPQDHVENERRVALAEAAKYLDDDPCKEYHSTFAEVARCCCRAFGPTDDQLADFFGISAQTFEQWQVDHPEFARACREWKVR